MQTVYTFRYLKEYTRFMKTITLLNHPKRRDIERRVKIIEFFDTYGHQATQAAFGTSRSSVFGWKQRLRNANGQLTALAPQSKAPKHQRTRQTNPVIVTFIKGYRAKYPGVGKTTIKPALDEYCQVMGIPSVCESTIGRLIGDLKERGQLSAERRLSLSARTGKLIERVIKRRKKLRRHGYQPQAAGDLVQLDSITIFIDGLKRYLITAIDLKTRFAFALAYSSLTSANAKDFMEKFMRVAPFTTQHVQTDNGSEFEALFDQSLKDQGITHFWNYPHYPKGNAYIERFNRTIQDQYVSWQLTSLANPATFNVGLVDWLLWYNTQKPHQGLGKLPPLRYFVNTFIQPLQSNMLWTSTRP